MPLGDFVPAKGWGFPPKGLVSSPIGSLGGGYHPFVVVPPPFSVILSDYLEPQYWKTNCLRSICCAVRRTPLGMGVGACPISILGMEVGEVMEGQGTTYGFTLSVLLHIGLCICVSGCLTWLGTDLQVGSEMGLQT